MKITRQDAWTEDEDILLAETILRYIRQGKTQLDAFQEVAEKLTRTPAACGFRWNSTIRKQYTDAINLARNERKNGYFMKEQKNKKDDFQKEVKEAISILTKVKKMSESNSSYFKNGHSNMIDSLRNENNQLKKKLKRYEEAWEEMGKLWTWVKERTEAQTYEKP